jgi:hypothetical protein
MNGRRHPTLRYASYDHCFNYFQDLRETNQIASAVSEEKSQLSCLHLGYYLASWGMFRGKAALLRHSSRALLPAVELIVRAPRVISETDIDSYDDIRIEATLDVRDEFREVVPGGRSGALTLKIMLGVLETFRLLTVSSVRGLVCLTLGEAPCKKDMTITSSIVQRLKRVDH